MRQIFTAMNQSSVFGKSSGSVSKGEDARAQQDTIEALETDLRKAEETIAQLREEWKQATNELLLLREDPSNYKVDDRTIRVLYEQLIAKIEDWVSFYCTSNDRQIQDVDLDLLRASTPSFEKYLQFDNLKTLLIRSCVMRLVFQRVLCDSSGSGLLWAGSVRQDFRNLIDKLKPGTSRPICTFSAALILRR